MLPFKFSSVSTIQRDIDLMSTFFVYWSKHETFFPLINKGYLEILEIEKSQRNDDVLLVYAIITLSTFLLK